jgi:5'-methylthioadenosine phosphorylase
MSVVSPEFAVIGGSGFYRYLGGARQLDIPTPYGSTSAPLTVGELQGRHVAFLARHGEEHQWPPHLVNYRANLWALREIGVQRVVGSCAAGSLRADLRPGELVVLDQLVDRTSGRPDTFVDGAPVTHVSFAEPYCAALSERLYRVSDQAEDVVLHPRGTVVVIQGPRFSTRAESVWFQGAGWDVVNMTQYPEAYLARELGLCYAGLALVTDYDAGTAQDPSIVPVSMAAVLEVLRQNIGRAQRLLLALAKDFHDLEPCSCAMSRAR